VDCGGEERGCAERERGRHVLKGKSGGMGVRRGREDGVVGKNEVERGSEWGSGDGRWMRLQIGEKEVTRERGRRGGGE